MNKIDNRLAKLIKKKKKIERTQINNIINEKKIDVTTDTTKIQRIIRDY